jgi:two-component system KDP operon response regulator KdpE
MSAKVLLIDDDIELGRLVEIVLRPIGIVLYQSCAGLQGLKDAFTLQPDVIMLDIGLPDLDGFEVCQRLREMTDLPILMLTAHTDEHDMLRGFGVGADDFMKKPFNKNELEVRIRALLRRLTPRESERSLPVCYNDPVLDIDLRSRTVRLRGEVVRLSPREYALLAHLVGVQGRVATYYDLMREGWGEFQVNGTSLISLNICHLRKKLQDGQHGHQYIRTDWGRGYWFEVRKVEAAAEVGDY